MQCKYTISERVRKILGKAGFSPMLVNEHTYNLQSRQFKSCWNVENEYSAWVTARGEQPEQQELIKMVCYPRYDAAYIQAKLFWIDPRLYKFLNFFMYDGARTRVYRQLIKALFFIKKTYRISPLPIVSSVLSRADAPMLRWRVDNVGQKKERVVPFLLYEEKHASLILSQAIRYLVFEFYIFKELFKQSQKPEKKTNTDVVEQVQASDTTQAEKNSTDTVDESKSAAEQVVLQKRKTTRLRKIERFAADKQMSLDVLSSLLKNKKLFKEKRMLLQAVYDLRKTAQCLNNSIQIIRKIKVRPEYLRNKLYIQLAYFFMYMYYQPGILKYYKIEAAAFAVANIKNMPRPRPVLETPFRHTPQNWWYGHYGYAGIHNVTEVLRPVSVHLRSRQRPGVGYD